jgi:class 3 adenylate cyclase
MSGSPSRGRAGIDEGSQVAMNKPFAAPDPADADFLGNVAAPERKAPRPMGEATGIRRHRRQFANGVGRTVMKPLADAARTPPCASMGSSPIERRWLAILVTDVACYSRLMELDELGTAVRVHRLRRHLIVPMARAHRGWVVDHAGDGTLMAFAQCDDAVNCAVALRCALGAVERDVPADRRIELHLGISADTVLLIDGEPYGNALNVAARLQNLAPSGEIYLSGDAFRKAAGRVDVGFEALGERRVRNIRQPVEVYRVCPAAAEEAPGAVLAPGPGPLPAGSDQAIVT